jgi:glycosyltransferase involved in cell wall biosynthesis
MRYAWLPELDTRRPGGGAVTRSAQAALRSWDRHSASWVDSFTANSATVRDRIRRFYERDARVVHPPVDVEFFNPGDASERGKFALAVSRFIPYKRLDLAIEAAAVADVDLVMAGSGPEEGRLRDIAAARHPGRVSFCIAPRSDELRELYRRASALVYPGREDFGIVPVEAQACGTPVVALGIDGTKESVVHGETGILVKRQDPELLAEGIRELLRARFSPDRCVRNAQRFSRARFNRQIYGWVDACLELRSDGAQQQDDEVA